MIHNTNYLEVKLSKPYNRDHNTKKPHGTCVAVRNGDVNKALKILKKILESDNRQKELAKREYFEKPSLARKRRRNAAKKRHQKDREKQLANGQIPMQMQSGVSYMKSKRKRRQVDDKLNLYNTGMRKKKDTKSDSRR